MAGNFKAVRLSYKTAPLEIREAVALSEEEARRVLATAKDFLNIPELMLLSTCNRTEAYYSAEEDLSESIIKLITLQKQMSGSEELCSYFESITDANQAARHLFRVSLGLESQVVGDLQITSQVKNAYQWAADADMAGPFLHRLMHTIFFSNKKVVQQTAFRDGAASVSYAAVELVDILSKEIIDPKVVVLGLGKMGADVARNLKHTGIEEIYLANRTFSKTKELAEETAYKAIPLEEGLAMVEEADVVISAMATQEPIITKELLAQTDSLRFKYFLDLSVPRSVAKDVEEINGMVVYNIDHINNRANEALERRTAAIPEVEALVEEGLQEFFTWTKDMEVSPTIKKFKSALEQIRQEELSRFTKQLNLSDTETKQLEKITKAMMQKVLKQPVIQLKAACKRGEADTLIDSLYDLFNLEKDEEMKA